MIVIIGERPPPFGALSPVVRPPKVDRSSELPASVVRSITDHRGIDKGDRAGKHRSVPEGDVPERGNYF